MKIIVAIQSNHRSQARYEVFESDKVSIGRGFNNDLILNDPYVSLNHLQIICDGENITIEDCSSKNGTYIVKTKKEVQGGSLIDSGTELVLGRSRIRIFLNTHAMDPTKPFMKSNKFVSLMRKPLTASILMLFVMIVSVFFARLEMITKEPVAKYLIYPISELLIVLVWAGFWAFVGKLIRHKAHFFVYVSCYCVWYLTSTALAAVNDYIGFYMNNDLVYTISSYIMYGGLSIMVLYFCLSFVTNMSRKANLIFSTLFITLIISSSVGIAATIKEYYNYQPPYNTLLKPPVFGVRKGVAINQFIENSETIFEFE